MSAGHTPGPWAWAENEHEANLYGIGAGGNWLATVRHNGEELPDKQRANIRLIAAAPELLEALKNLLSEVEGCGRPSLWLAARAAISKATHQPS